MQEFSRNSLYFRQVHCKRVLLYKIACMKFGKKRKKNKRLGYPAGKNK